MNNEQKRLYLDFASAHPIKVECLNEFNRISKMAFANPSSAHFWGQETQKIYLNLKNQLFEYFNFQDGQVINTSSASEANNTIIHNFLSKYPKGHIYIGADCHSSLTFILNNTSNSTYLIPLNQNGEYDFSNISFSQSEKSLICLNIVAQDSGILHDYLGISYQLNQEHLFLHFDATQAINKINLDFEQFHFHSLCFSAHKLGAVRGSAPLFIRNFDLSAMIKGGSQEYNNRSGTENIAALASCLKSLCYDEAIISKLTKIEEDILSELAKLNQTHHIIKVDHKVPGIINILFPGYQGSELVAALSLKGIAISSGSACLKNKKEPLASLISMGYSENDALSSIRLSYDHSINSHDLSFLIESLHSVLNELS